MDANRAEYGDNTNRYFNALCEGRVTLEQVGDRQNVLIVDGDSTTDPVNTIRQILPSYEHIKMILLYSREDKETLRSYAERIGMHYPELSMYTARNPKRHIPRSAVIKTLLSRSLVPNASEVGHILMELRLPGLFTKTYDKNENLRNYVMACFFEYASSESAKGNEQPWRQLLQSALAYYGCEKTVWQKLNSEPVTKKDSEMALFESWRDGFQKIQSSDISYTPFRVEMREQYAAFHENVRPGAFYRRVCERYPCFTYEYVASFFSAMDINHNRCSRDSIIKLGLFMECTLEEINRMLMEANQARVYPLSSWEEERDYAGQIARSARTCRKNG